MQRLESKATLARIAGVSRAAIGQACKASLKDACVDGKVDVAHPSVIAYLIKKGVDPTAVASPIPVRPDPTPKRRRRSPQKDAPGAETGPGPNLPAPEPEHVSTTEVASFANKLTLAQLIKRFGTVTLFKDWLIARKRIADIVEKELRNHATRGTLIERDMVRTFVFGAIETSNRRLLDDAPTAITARLFALALSGASQEEAESAVCEIISSQLAPMQTTVERILADG